MGWTAQLLHLLVLLMYVQMTLCRRSFSPYIPTLNLDLEPPLPTGDDMDSHEQSDFRPFPSLRSKPPVLLPKGSLLRPNGSVHFPNNSILMTTYYKSGSNPTMEGDSGTVRLANGSTVSASSTPYPLPVGLVLNSTNISSEGFPSLVLPRGSLVFRNGTILVYGRYKIPTVFVEGFIPYCDGIKCHMESP